MLYLVIILVIIGAIATGIMNWIKKRGGKVSSQNKEKEEETEVFVVMEGNNKRELKYLPQRGSTMDYNPESPYNGKRYEMYIDDLGYYWRSYDSGKTFIKEIGYKNDIV